MINDDRQVSSGGGGYVFEGHTYTQNQVFIEVSIVTHQAVYMRFTSQPESDI